MINLALFQGRLTKDCELKTTTKGSFVAEFCLAQSVPVTEDVIYLNCKLFGQSAQKISSYLKKGKQLIANGRLDIRQYTDKVGNKRDSITLLVERVEFINGTESKEPKKDTATKKEKTQEVQDDDLPF